MVLQMIWFAYSNSGNYNNNDNDGNKYNNIH